MKIEPEQIFIEDFSYLLPEEKIAFFPKEKRDDAKLLLYKKGNITDHTFSNLPQLLDHDTLVVLNNTRVLEARLLFQKPTGGIIEIFCLEPYGQTNEVSLAQFENVRWKCIIGGASKWKPGQILHKEITINNLTVVLSATYISKEQNYFIIEFSWKPASFSFAEILHNAGAIPLPPYIKRSPLALDLERYQTVFSKQQGSVAAPTAGLHFSKEILQQLENKNVSIEYVTLHVGAGTFKPVTSATLAEHKMHSEPFSISLDLIQKILGTEKVLAVGTTSLRTLESLHWLGVKLIKGKLINWHLEQWEAYELEDNKISYKESLSSIIKWMNENKKSELNCRTSLIIVPGYCFQIAQGLITNFHQPNSTLLLLIASFIGDDWRNVYEHALNNNYRFLSYGDGSLLWREPAHLNPRPT